MYDDVCSFFFRSKMNEEFSDVSEATGLARNNGGRFYMNGWAYGIELKHEVASVYMEEVELH